MGYSRKGRPLYILDGYNIVFNPVFKRGEEDIELLRSRLNDYLEGYLLDKNVDVIVVWDGTRGAGGIINSSRGRVKNVFTRPPENADTRIIRIVEKYDTKGRIIVVSDDRRHITGVVKNLGARAVGVRSFLNLIGFGVEVNKYGRDKEDYYSEGEEKKLVEDISVEEWIKIFKSRKKESS